MSRSIATPRIWKSSLFAPVVMLRRPRSDSSAMMRTSFFAARSEEHTSELQSRLHLVCRLLLEKKTNVPVCWPALTADETAWHPAGLPVRGTLRPPPIRRHPLACSYLLGGLHALGWGVHVAHTT